MHTRSIRLTSAENRQKACAAIQSAPEGWVVEIHGESRSAAQNRKLWPMLADFAAQVTHNGRRYSKENWKDLLTAAFVRAEVVPGLDGGVVALGLSTSRMTMSDFSELVEFIYAMGAEYGVEWSDEALEVYQTYREAA